MLMRTREIVEGEPAKVMAMGGVRKCVRAGVVWQRDMNSRTRLADPVQLIHNTDNIMQVLHDIVSVHFLERVIRERPREHVQIMNDLWSRIGSNIQVDSARHFLSAAAKIKRG